MKRAAFAMTLSMGLLGAGTAAADTPEVAVEAGFSHRALYRVPIEMVSFAGMFGGQGEHVSYGLSFGFEWGKTLEGLTVMQGRLGLIVEWVEGRARLGGGFGLGGVTIARATNTNSLGVLFIEGVLRASADLVYFGARRDNVDGKITARPALLLAAELRTNTARVWGPSLLLGVRY